MTRTAIAPTRPAEAIHALAALFSASVDVTPQALTERHAADLQAYIRALEQRARDADVRERQGTVGLRRPVLAFAWMMEHKLRKHDDTRGPHGWQDVEPEHFRWRIGQQLPELSAAVGAWYGPWGDSADAIANAVAEKAADVANFAMMTADACGALEGVGPGPVHKMRARLRQVHRLHAHITRLIERRLAETDPPAPEHKIIALSADAKALAWVLNTLDPSGAYRPAIAGDGSGQALPPANGDQVREAPAIARELIALPVREGCTT